VKASTFTGLGQALRWLRERQTRKQYQVADLAGITKGMLSAYETGRQRPSLETLDKLLDTLGCDLNDLHNAIQIVNGRPEAIRRFAPPGARPPSAGSYSGAAGGINGGAGGSFGQTYPLRRRSSDALGGPRDSRDSRDSETAGVPDTPGSRDFSGGPCNGEGSDQVRQVDEIAETPDASELYRVLGHSGPLPDPEERALAQVLDGFHQLIRYWDQALERLGRNRASAPPEPSEPAEPAKPG
jgi:DNA-binding XRE family transcriptional regulator